MVEQSLTESKVELSQSKMNNQVELVQYEGQDMSAYPEESRRVDLG